MRREVRKVTKLCGDILHPNLPRVHPHQKPLVGARFVAGTLACLVGGIAERHDAHRGLRMIGVTIPQFILPFGESRRIQTLRQSEITGRKPGISAIAKTIVRIDRVLARFIHCRVEENPHAEIVLAERTNFALF